ncbi:inner membrane or exported protein [Vibrio ishigakensis]|uniref:Inner membrane or exported protein n=1 Tax=Vibrio ishigakensis TaxID=1481914 RepID=A0A0B8QLW8_9VIBR|nr:inner membrane or exported protein [Vibrio ishigakensis]
MKVFAVIDHSAGAKSVGIDLKPTELVVFGNPKVGSPLMVCEQSVAIDLPQKALIYEDESGEVWLSYNDPMYLKQRHQIEGCDEVLNKISKALANFAKAATQ